MDIDHSDDFIIEFEEDTKKTGELGSFPSKLPPPEGQVAHLEPSGPVFSEAESISGSYLSAEFAAVQAIDDHKSLLILKFQCHPAIGNRFSNAKITWKFRHPAHHGPSPAAGVTPPKVIDHAPRKSYGGCTTEQRRLHWGLSLPLQFGVGAASTGVQPSGELETEKAVDHALTITGTARGAPVRTSCVWTVEENRSGAQGIPSQFQLAVVLEHKGPIVTELDVQCELSRGMSWARWIRARKDPGTKGTSTKTINIDSWRSKTVDYGPAENWKAFLADLTGEVPGAVVAFQQPLIRT